MSQPHELTVAAQAAAIRSRELSPLELVEHYLARIERLDQKLGAYVTVTAERARDEARKAGQRVMEAADPSDLPPLLGIPVPIKDLNSVKGVRVSYGSAVYADLTGPVDDNVVTFLREAGSIMLGKTSTPEFGLPCYTEGNAGPPARTPWDLSRSAGGSSGGAAAAVAAGLAPAAQGSDGGGSIRIPASACGLVGIKPTRGRVSPGPLVPDLAGLGICGPLARTVEDAALLLDAMAGNVPGDMYHAPPADDSFVSYAHRPPGRLRIGRRIQPVIADAEVHPDCVEAYEAATALLTELGHEVVDLPEVVKPEAVPHFEVLWASMATLMPVPAERADRMTPLTTWLRERGQAISATRLLQAQTALQHVMRAALPTMATCDAVLHPTLAQPPAPVGYFTRREPEADFELQKKFTPYTAVYNMSGQPAVSLPLHWSADALPIGVMLAGRFGGEGTLISLAAQLEAAQSWHHRHPPLWD